MENPETFFKKIIKINYSNLLEIIEKLIVKDFHHKKLSTIIGISSIAGERGKKDNCIYSLVTTDPIRYGIAPIGEKILMS